MNKILITPRSLTREGDPGLKRLEEAGYSLVFATPGQMPEEKELISLLPGCAGWLAGVEKITEKVLDAAADCKVISRNGTGIDSIDLEAAERRGIQVERAQGANARGVAELAVTLMLSASCAFITPTGYQTNLMVWGPGGYAFADFAKIGTAMTLIVAVTTLVLAPMVFGF